jgi:hypothetical protein
LVARPQRVQVVIHVGRTEGVIRRAHSPSTCIVLTRPPHEFMILSFAGLFTVYYDFRVVNVIHNVIRNYCGVMNRAPDNRKISKFRSFLITRALIMETAQRAYIHKNKPRTITKL